jgi:hypothetical protein
MKYGYRTLHIVIATLLFASSCNPQSRFLRLVENHPYLLDSFTSRNVQIKTIKEIDTQFVWKKERDTIRFNDYRLERFRDTLRFFTQSRNCTTHINTTEVRPSKTIEKYIERKSEEGLKGQVYQGLAFILIGFIIALILKK